MTTVAATSIATIGNTTTFAAATSTTTAWILVT